jgi:hypothetical protein
LPEVSVIVLPLISSLVALACALAVGRDLLRKAKPDRATWLVAFLLFAIAAGAEVIGEASGWTTLLVRVYYVSGAVLVVGFLALGQLYLTAPKRIAGIAPGVALLMTALSVSAVWGASIDQTRLEDDGWHALERTTGLTLLTIGINSIGTLILIGGLAYSAWKFRQLGTMRNRMLGCLLIAIGTLSIAAGGTLTRLGSDQYLYIAMSVGIGMIFFGYLWTKVPDGQAFRSAKTDRGVRIPEPIRADQRSPGVVYLENLMATLDDAALKEALRIWSVPAREIDAFSRAEARRVWAFRNRLGSSGQTAFDQRPPDIRLQLTETYFEVMTADVSSLERPTPSIGVPSHRDDQPVRIGSGSVD